MIKIFYFLILCLLSTLLINLTMNLIQNELQNHYGLINLVGFIINVVFYLLIYKKITLK